MIKKEILINQRKLQSLDFIQRTFDLQEIESIFKLNKICALIGPRRSGKTFLTFQILRELIAKGNIQLESVCYIDFSALLDQRITIEQIKDAYISLFPDIQPIFVFDEIQELENFPTQLIHLLNEGYKILITGSNAHLLSRELSTILRGKVYTKEVFPLDFKEYLHFKGLTPSSHDLIVDKAKYKYYFSDFLLW
jgi:predicted AAA+ superfamily ATPase